MFYKELAHYIDPETKNHTIVDTKNEYEFTMAAVLINQQWYVLVENADPSRLYDINEVVELEFDASVEGWCVIKKHQHMFGKILPFDAAPDKTDAITVREGDRDIWLMKVNPRADSRLVSLLD